MIKEYIKQNTKPKIIDVVDLFNKRGDYGIGSLTVEQLHRIKKVSVNDLVIPIDIAVEIKGVSRQAIGLAISRGDLHKVSGVLLSDLKRYEVDEAKVKSGKSNAKAKIKSKIRKMKKKYKEGLPKLERNKGIKEDKE